MEANIDNEKLVELVQGSPELLKNIFHVATEDWDVQLQALEMAIHKKDYAVIQAKIHRLNGGLRSFYATEMVEELSRWEKAAKAEENRDWATFLKKVKLLLEELKRNILLLISHLESPKSHA